MVIHDEEAEFGPAATRLVNFCGLTGKMEYGR